MCAWKLGATETGCEVFGLGRAGVVHEVKDENVLVRNLVDAEERMGGNIQDEAKTEDEWTRGGGGYGKGG